MAESDKPKSTPDADLLAPGSAGPLVFISHDGRDAELAEAFSKLLKSVSAGMIKTFRSSDKKGTEGIDFGEEWYKRLMTQLQSTSDVVCLFTERSLDRPWILFEAGVAKGKLDTPVLGVALGVPLSRVSAGPFYQFMNMDDSEADLTKLVNQLARRVPSLELDGDVVKGQVAAFKTTEATLLAQLSSGAGKAEIKEAVDESAIAKLAEEMKALPSRVAERLAESGDPLRRRRMRRFHPMMFEELIHMSGEPGDPVAILMAASVVKDDMPWLYELAMEVYRAVKARDDEAISRELKRLRRFSELTVHGPFIEEFGFVSKESHILAMEFPRMLEQILMRTLGTGASHSSAHAKSKKPHQESGAAG
ncbi:MAG TPA: toll/interleukin-1 receptor domain-containing protein [Thermoanaerobaculia bacterium]|nr:toll/interleukin-1 receptor domain-containing protein [Thermoanaerobaculia bacterium]